jgi:hypothetical protein
MFWLARTPAYAVVYGPTSQPVHCNVFFVSSYISLPRTLEEEPDHQNLQCSHTNHHHDLNHAEVEYPALRTPHRAEIAIFARPEIFLHPRHRRQLRADLEDRIFQRGRLFGGRAAFHREECGARFVLDLLAIWTNHTE